MEITNYSHSNYCDQVISGGASTFSKSVIRMNYWKQSECVWIELNVDENLDQLILWVEEYFLLLLKYPVFYVYLCNIIPNLFMSWPLVTIKQYLVWLPPSGLRCQWVFELTTSSHGLIENNWSRLERPVLISRSNVSRRCLTGLRCWTWRL